MNIYEKKHNQFIKDAIEGKRLSPLKAIRHFCLSCMGFVGSEVNDCCGDDNCPLFKFRHGKNTTGKKTTD